MPNPEIPRRHQINQDESAPEHSPLISKITKAIRSLLGKKSRSRLGSDVDEILKEDEKAEKATRQAYKKFD